jgi:hypothetical protein
MGVPGVAVIGMGRSGFPWPQSMTCMAGRQCNIPEIETLHLYSKHRDHASNQFKFSNFP